MIYFMFLNIFIVFGLLTTCLKRQSEVTILSFIVLFAVSVFLVFRDVDVGQDTVNYLYIFHAADSATDTVDVGFLFFVKAVRVFVSSGTAYLVVQAFVTNAIIYMSYRAAVGKFALYAMALLACTHVFWMVHILVIRNGMAAALLLAAIVALLKSRRLMFAVLGCASISTHFVSALPAAAAYAGFTLSQRKFKLKALLGTSVVALLVLGLLYVARDSIQESLFVFYQKFDDNVMRGDLGAMKESAFGFQYIPAIGIVLLTFFSWKSLDAFSRRLFYIYLVLVSVSMLFWWNILFRDRLFLFAQLFEPLILVNCMLRLQKVGVGKMVLASIFYLWSVGVIFVWGPANILTHY